MSGAVLGLIAARGGSKRLPGKNLRPFLGAPLIAHTIAAARACARLDRVVLSTDDPEIAAVAARHGCEVPFLRPAELADDAASSVDMALHALDVLAAQGARYGLLVLLQPTSPLRLPGDIDACVARCLDDGAPACVTVSRAPKPVDHFGALDPDGRLDRAAVAAAAGDRPLAVLNGACYAIRTEVLRAARSFLPEGATTSETPWLRGADIDTLEDFEVAERVARLLAEAGSGWRNLTGTPA